MWFSFTRIERDFPFTHVPHMIPFCLTSSLHFPLLTKHQSFSFSPLSPAPPHYFPQTPLTPCPSLGPLGDKQNFPLGLPLPLARGLPWLLPGQSLSCLHKASESTRLDP